MSENPSSPSPAPGQPQPVPVGPAKKGNKTVLIIVLAVVGGLAVLGAIGGFLVLRAQADARREVCRANFNGIGKAMAFYEATNRDRMPERLEQLIESGFIDEEALTCPKAKKQGIGWQENLFYLTPRSSTPLKAIIVAEKTCVHKAGRHVLRRIGKEDFLTDEQFAAELAKPENADFAKAFKAAGGQVGS